MMDIEALKYPIGKFEKPSRITLETIGRWIDEIEHLPTKLRNVVQNLHAEALSLTYRPDGWTLRQVIHHLPDSHMNSYIRFRWALTEEKPVIKSYHEDRWAELSDARDANIEISLILLEALHIRWTMLLRAMELEDLHRVFIHPDTGREVRLDENIGIYAWHGNHHLAQITTCLDRNKKLLKT
jgi:uncharacterized damage-inducible protein DinB